jgi:hypothetical protein
VKRRSGLLLLAFVVFGLPDDAHACTSAYPYASNAADLIGFTAGSGFLGDASIISAIGMWSGCNEDGWGFPSLAFNQPGSINIVVQLLAGANPIGIGGCGFFDHQLSNSNQVQGGTIYLYELTGDGKSCADTRVETIAHEIGHVLGLHDSTCSGYIMSGNLLYPSRSVRSSECAFADTRWTTSAETGGGGGGGTENPNTNCPLLLDLNGDGIRTASILDAARFFDPDGDGVPNEGGWTNASSEDAFVWIDVDHDDGVDRGELLGTGMLLPGGAIAKNGFQVLRVYDAPVNGGNADGVISRDDAVFTKLRLWIDRNHDGVSQETETSAAASRVIAIDADFTHRHEPDGKGNMLMLEATYLWRHGHHVERRSAVDVGFRVRSW